MQSMLYKVGAAGPGWVEMPRFGNWPSLTP